MGPFLLFIVLGLLAGAVATILFWAAAAAIAVAIVSAILWVLKLAWWLITRPIVWPIRAVQSLFKPQQPTPKLNITPVPPPPSAQSVGGKAERLERLKALLDTGALTRAEFDQLKADILV